MDNGVIIGQLYKIDMIKELTHTAGIVPNEIKNTDYEP
jgi:hypothetical protein